MLLIMNKIQYQGWELEHFDNSYNFRKYQNELIKDYIKGYVAEVGPGNGENLQIYMNNVDKLDLYEPSINLFNNLKKKFEKNKNFFFKNEIFSIKENTYDTIIYLDVLEHIENDSEELIKAFNSLKPNGKLIINAPAFQHLYSNFDRDVNHFRRYNKNSMFKLFKDLNFSSYNMKYYDSLGYFLSLMSNFFTSDYKKNFQNKIKLWNFLVPFSRLLDKFVFHLFGKSLLIIITK